MLDESGANLAMGRSHAWLPRGTALIEARPMHWGDHLTLVGAIRVDRWLTLATSWGSMNRVRFVAWVRRHLVRHLRRGDVVIMDNLAAHKTHQVRALMAQAGATVRFLPPYSHDVNPIEAAWALIKKRIRTVAPRTGPRSGAPRNGLAESCSLATATTGLRMRVTNSSDRWDVAVIAGGLWDRGPSSGDRRIAES